MQPFGTQRTKSVAPMLVSSTLSPSPPVSSTPSGATTRRMLARCPSMVRKATTSRPTFWRSCAATVWTSEHCSTALPGTVSQRICQSPKRAGCAPAGASPGCGS